MQESDANFGCVLISKASFCKQLVKTAVVLRLFPALLYCAKPKIAIIEIISI